MPTAWGNTSESRAGPRSKHAGEAMAMLLPQRQTIVEPAILGQRRWYRSMDHRAKRKRLDLSKRPWTLDNGTGHHVGTIRGFPSVPNSDKWLLGSDLCPPERSEPAKGRSSPQFRGMCSTRHRLQSRMLEVLLKTSLDSALSFTPPFRELLAH